MRQPIGIFYYGPPTGWIMFEYSDHTRSKARYLSPELSKEMVGAFGIAELKALESALDRPGHWTYVS